ncbi:hypothetical protein [Streptomyces noursei]|uniref:hypothetical protein n=1 Tax=Streptomyces noursei TaxID=1971 RepID=UPI0016737704|nr:hypothetical protein [Streptomyces noursei]MCZ1013573.1 hypothetical protein [Streptomyces noursei]GGX25746.1 hypothetical protein GCM10010341_53790 [Streptomyces noursei]
MTFKALFPRYRVNDRGRYGRSGGCGDWGWCDDDDYGYFRRPFRGRGGNVVVIIR